MLVNNVKSFSIISLILVLFCAFAFSCKGGGDSIQPPDGDVSANVKNALVQTIALVERAIVEEDPNLASNQVADIFRMDGLVAFRFRRSNAPAQPSPQTNIASLFNDFYRDNENVIIDLSVTKVTQNGDLATADLEFHLSATYVLESPPINYFVDALDRITFQREQGAWKVIAWEEVEEVSAGDEDNPGNLEPIVAINRTIKNLEEVINSRNFKLKDKTISSIFAVDSAVGKRFWTPTTTSGGNPQAGFEAFFKDVFAYNENIVFTLTVSNWEITEDVATVTVSMNFLATYVLSVPPQVYDAQATDQINLRLENDGLWRIISWVEGPSGDPEPVPFDLCRLSVLNLQESIRGKDLSLVGDSLTDGFRLNSVIASRFRTHISEAGGNPSSNLFEYMSLFFSENVNVDFQLSLSNFSRVGDIATGTISYSLNSTYILTVPPTFYAVNHSDDVMQFLRSSEGVWQIMYWIPASPDEPTDSDLIVDVLENLGSYITARNSNEAANLFSGLFMFDSEVALLFPTHHSVEDPPSQNFKEHIDTFLFENANIAVSLAPLMSTLTINGELAHIEFDFTVESDYFVVSPIQHFNNNARCLLELTKSSGKWQIYAWTRL